MTDNSSNGISILLIDDHELVRDGLTLLLESQSGFKIVGDTGKPAEALELAKQGRPDVILLDIDLGGYDGLELIPTLSESAPDSKIIILTGSSDRKTHQRAARLGASGLVLKEKAKDVLLKAIEKVNADEIWFDRSLLKGVLSDISHADTNLEKDKIASLTRAERDVIEAFRKNLTTTKEIASYLHIEPSTVDKHLTSIYSKLEVSNRLGLVIYAYNHGLLKLSSDETSS